MRNVLFCWTFHAHIVLGVQMILKTLKTFKSGDVKIILSKAVYVTPSGDAAKC